MIPTSVPQLFLAVETALYNATEHAEIQEKIRNFGYTPKRMQEGNALLNQARMLHDHKADRYEQQGDLSRQVKLDKITVRSAFGRHLDIAKLAFAEQPDILAKLRPRLISHKIAEWTAQAKTFYTKIEPYAAYMERYHVTLEEMQQAKAMIDAFLTSRNQRLQKKGDAEESTRVRNEAVRTLRIWIREFYSMARIALKDSPQLLEALGIKVPSEK